MTWLILISSLGLGAGLLALLRWGKLPPFSHRDALALIAMFATVGGAMILTLMVDKGNDVFTRQADRLINDLVVGTSVNDAVAGALTTIISAQAFNLKLALAGIIVVLLSLGLVISARTLKASGFGANLELGTDEHGNPALPVLVKNSEEKPVQVEEAVSNQHNSESAPASPVRTPTSTALPESIPGTL